MIFNLDILNKYIEDGLLECQSHPTLPLKIYNYSRDCQFEKKWDSITLAMRGTVIDNEGNLIAKSLNKFFNIEEIGINNLPNEEFEVFEKMDGSCIICFYYNNQWICASRGSFTSPQAIRANELLLKYPIEKLNKKNTYIFEVIY
jgi:RNA ligase